MTVLTHTEGIVVDIVREFHERHKMAMATHQIREVAWDTRRIRYDTVQRTLRTLVEKDVLFKPERGYYRPVTR